MVLLEVFKNHFLLFILQVQNQRKDCLSPPSTVKSHLFSIMCMQTCSQTSIYKHANTDTCANLAVHVHTTFSTYTNTHLPFLLTICSFTVTLMFDS